MFRWEDITISIYEGGGEAAVFEPLEHNIKPYSFGLAQYLGAGVAACYRGFRLYDSQETRDKVLEWVTFYKKYREILGGDIIHIKHSTMQGLDAWLHINPTGHYKGLVMVFNPTSNTIIKLLPVPLYYTGLVKTALVSEAGQGWRQQQLGRDYKIILEISLEPESLTYFVVK